MKWLVAAVITAGAVATAIGAIAALWPGPNGPPAELRAEFSDVSVDPNVTLDEFEARQDEPQGSSAPNHATEPQLVSVTVAQGTTVDTATTTTDTTTTETTTTDTTTTSTDTTTSTTTTTTDTTTTETSEEGEGIIVVKPQLSEEAEMRLREGVRQALRDPAVVDGIELGSACAEGLNSPDCGLSSSALYIKWEDEAGEPGQVSQAKVAEQVAELLADTRTLQLPSGVQPLGVTVNYKISLTGFRGRKVDVRWALHRPGGGQLPQDWLKNQRAALLEGEADKDSASPSFWVPLPATVEGPFFIRLTVINQAGVALDREDTEPFR